MKIVDAIKTLQILLVRNADCRCGNYDLDEEEKEAVRIALDSLWVFLNSFTQSE